MPGIRLSQDEREEIALGLATQRSFSDIGRQLDRPTSTVAREVDRNGGRGRYRATRAQRATDVRGRRPKVRRLVAESRRLLWYHVANDRPQLLVIVRDPDGIQPDDYFITDTGADPAWVAGHYAGTLVDRGVVLP